MASFSAFKPVDMLDFARRGGTPYHINDRLTYMEFGDSYWYVFGKFKFPHGEWKGTIKRIEVYGPDGDLKYEFRGLDLNALKASIGPTSAFAVRGAFDGRDVIAGSNGADRLAGFLGDDKISGRGGADSIYGNEGNDTLSGGRGDDRLFGGLGDDILRGDEGRDALRGGGGADRLFGGASADRLLGGEGADSLSGERGDDRMFGGRGSDLLAGGSGRDHLWGGDGVDRLFGGASADRLFGGKGADVLDGGRGDDELTGAGGADTFRFTSEYGRDVVTDFQVGVDSIEIDQKLADSYRDLVRENGDDGATITFGDAQVVLLNVDIKELDRGDFIFI